MAAVFLGATARGVLGAASAIALALTLVVVLAETDFLAFVTLAAGSTGDVDFAFVFMGYLTMLFGLTWAWHAPASFPECWSARRLLT